MSPSDVALLRSLVEWRRKNGWTREYRLWDAEQHDHTYEHRGSGLSVEATMHRITLFPGEPKVVYEVGVEQSGHLLFHGWPWSVRSAVNSIAAAEVIPPEMAPMFSSAFQLGRESAYTTDEWRVRSSKLFSEWSTNASREGADESLRTARHHYPDAWVEHRRTGATDWSRVDELQA